MPASVTTAELAELVAECDSSNECSPVRRTRISRLVRIRRNLRAVFGKSVVAARDLPAGHRLTREDLALKKPGTGIPAARWSEVCGRRLKQAVAADTLLAENDLA